MKTIAISPKVHSQVGQHRPRNLATLIAGVLVLALAFGLNMTVSAGNTPANTVEREYGNALELQYAQPWLNAAVDQAQAARQKKELEWLYAQPWMQVNSGSPTIQDRDLEWLYSQPWMQVDPE